MQCFNDCKCCLFCTLVALIFSDAASCHVSMSVQIYMFEGSRERERERWKQTDVKMKARGAELKRQVQTKSYVVSAHQPPAGLPPKRGRGDVSSV